jgi:hypothetical protein
MTFHRLLPFGRVLPPERPKRNGWLKHLKPKDEAVARPTARLSGVTNRGFVARHRQSCIPCTQARK